MAAEATLAMTTGAAAAPVAAAIAAVASRNRNMPRLQKPLGLLLQHPWWRAPNPRLKPNRSRLQFD
jgi:hypothetical protein